MKDFIVANWQNLLLGCIIVFSAVIVVMGILKKAVFNKIANKLVRKILLAFGSVILSLPFTALYDVADGIPFDYYWVDAIVNAVATVLAYWLYENTGLRNFIGYIGKKALCVFVKIFANTIDTEKPDVKLIQSQVNDLKKEVKTEVVKSSKKINSDTLKNL